MQGRLRNCLSAGLFVALLGLVWLGVTASRSGAGPQAGIPGTADQPYAILDIDWSLIGTARSPAIALPPRRLAFAPLHSLIKTVRLPADIWRTNEAALNIIKEAEGLRLDPYYLAGQWLVGYGHAITDEPLGPISVDDARNLLKNDVATCEEAVGRVISVPITRNEFSALVAFCYNVGQTRMAHSSIVRHINSGERVRAADSFLLYDNARINNRMQPVGPLAVRRERERELFLSSGAPLQLAYQLRHL